MKNLIKRVNELKKDRKLMSLVKKRIDEFESNKNYFSELCFCMLTANASAESGINCQKALGNKVKNLGEKRLSQELRKLKYRFPNKRAHYISLAQEKCAVLKKIIKMPSKQAREMLVKHFKGIGMKEASHFLRNIGRKDLAIIDRHIMRSIGFSGKMNAKNYIVLEGKLRQLSKKTRTNLAELDLLLWFVQTGKILK